MPRYMSMHMLVFSNQNGNAIAVLITVYQRKEKRGKRAKKGKERGRKEGRKEGRR